MTGIADEEYQDPNIPAVVGLVVGAKARPAIAGNDDLAIEAAGAGDAMRGLPLEMFFEPDDADPSIEKFANMDEFRVAMDRLTPVSEQEASAWVRARISERLERWADQLASIGL